MIDRISNGLKIYQNNQDNYFMTYSEELIKALGAFGRVYAERQMSNYTTFRTGGPADIVCEAENVKSLRGIIRLLREESVPYTVVGGGSNLLVGDRGLRGAVIAVREKKEAEGEIRINGLNVYADASVAKERFVDVTAEAGLAGAEFMAGIPGMIGGGIIMNAGTYMGSFVDIMRGVYYIDITGEERYVRVAPEMTSYRFFDLPDMAVITGADFELEKSVDSKKSMAKIQEILDDRANKHPLEYPSAGSVFKNPEGHSSWQLVDGAGLKGVLTGGAQVSEKHTNFIINRNGATSGDILRMIRTVQEKVKEKYGIDLEPEIKIIGEF